MLLRQLTSLFILGFFSLNLAGPFIAANRGLFRKVEKTRVEEAAETSEDSCHSLISLIPLDTCCDPDAGINDCRHCRMIAELSDQEGVMILPRPCRSDSPGGDTVAPLIPLQKYFPPKTPAINLQASLDNRAFETITHLRSHIDAPTPPPPKFITEIA